MIIENKEKLNKKTKKEDKLISFSVDPLRDINEQRNLYFLRDEFENLLYEHCSPDEYKYLSVEDIEVYFNDKNTVEVIIEYTIDGQDEIKDCFYSGALIVEFKAKDKTCLKELLLLFDAGLSQITEDFIEKEVDKELLNEAGVIDKELRGAIVNEIEYWIFDTTCRIIDIILKNAYCKTDFNISFCISEDEDLLETKNGEEN